MDIEFTADNKVISEVCYRYVVHECLDTLKIFFNAYGMSAFPFSICCVAINVLTKVKSVMVITLMHRRVKVSWDICKCGIGGTVMY